MSNNLIRRIHSAILKYVQECPIRLYNSQNHRILTRQLFGKYLIGKTATILDDVRSSRGSPEAIWKAVEKVGRYAILSHRWLEEEISLDEIPHAVIGDPVVKEEARRKLRGFFKAARDHSCQFVWFDTGCIDQKNGPELEESIRSMFSWYRNAYVCIVYLSGTDSAVTLCRDEWFRRGWTLQELLAPSRLQFYDQSWRKIGASTQFAIDRTIKTYDKPIVDSIISQIGISRTHLIDLIAPGPEHAVTIFRYIGRRETTRPEDLAYALISLLDVSLPIAYGEGGERAFYRLQVACSQDSPSRALFHWFGDPCRWNSMLACHPEAFSADRFQTIRSVEADVVDGEPQVVIPPIDHFTLASRIKFDDCFAHNNEDEDIVMNHIDNSFTFTNSGVGIMIWILRPAHRPRLLMEDQWYFWYSFSLFDHNDIVFASQNDIQSGNDDKFVIGVYGHEEETTYAALLKKGSPGGDTGYTRIAHWIMFCKLPPMTAIMKSRFATPRRVFIK